MKVSETGHAKNVANFENLITVCSDFGIAYNPSNTTITLANLSILQASAQSALDAVTNEKTLNDRATNNREVAFKAIPSLFTKVVNALDASGAMDQVVADARSINKRIQGKKTVKKSTPTSADASQLPEEESHSASNSHRSFDNQIATMQSLIQLLLKEPKYQPNESELSVGSLSSILALLKSTNLEAKQTGSALANARRQRDKVLYMADPNIYEAAQDVKKYIKSIFGANSSEFRHVVKIKITGKPTAG